LKNSSEKLLIVLKFSDMVFKYNRKEDKIYAPELDGQELDILLRISVSDGVVFYVSVFMELGDEYGNVCRLLKFQFDADKMDTYTNLLRDYVTDELILTIRDCKINEVLDTSPKFIPLMKRNNRLF
jgi:hypothetical protein